ncbi:hypothetical protein [Saccharibacillus qingshengii]|uniref:hypothetical protein n=1 Tax=Saccharibacillus qingshengii TaxID=1763540 RepID=UPI0015550C0B|nr:hypothetical protein [Saccharibacillus qingshengii]
MNANLRFDSVKVLVIGVTGASAGAAAAAAAPTNASTNAPTTVPTNVLADPDWTYEIPGDRGIESLFAWATVGGGNVNFRAESGENSFIAQAVDRKSGDKINWAYDFRGDTKVLTGGSLHYGSNGDVYFLSKKSEEKTHTIRAVDAQGKLKWTTPVKVDVGDELTVLPNGDIVLHNSVQETKKAKAYTTFQTFGSDGKLKSEKKVTDSGIFKMLRNGQVLRNDTGSVKLYANVNALSKPILNLKMSEYEHLFYDFRITGSDYAVYPLNGGGTVIETYEEKIEPGKEGEVIEIDPDTIDTKRKLVGFDAKGKQTFERSLAKGDNVMATGSGFVLQKGTKFEAYDIHNKRTGAAALEGKDLWMMPAPSGEVTVASKKDGKFYALDAKTLKANYEVDMNAGAERAKSYSFYYAGKGELYTLEAGEKTLSRYTLK